MTDLLTQERVAKTFGISTRTMARMRAEGRGPLTYACLSAGVA